MMVSDKNKLANTDFDSAQAEHVPGRKILAILPNNLTLSLCVQCFSDFRGLLHILHR